MSRTKENTPVFTSENESIIQKIVNAFMGELEGYDSIDDKLTRIQELKFDRESKIKNNPNASDVKPLIAEAARRAEENIRTPKKAQTLAASTSAPNLSRRLFESPAPKPDKTLPENNFTASTGKSEQANEVTTLEKLKTIELQLAQIHQSLAQNSHQISVEESGVVDAVIGKLNAIKQLSGKQQATPANIDRDEPRIIGALKTTPIERRVTFTSSENSSPYTGISKSVSQISLSPTPQPFTYSDDVRRRRHSTFINTNIAPSPKLDKESISRAYKKLLNHRLGNHGKDRSPKKDDARINPISAEAFEFKSNMKFLKEALHDSMICLSSIDETKRNELLDQFCNTLQAKEETIRLAAHNAIRGGTLTQEQTKGLENGLASELININRFSSGNIVEAIEFYGPQGLEQSVIADMVKLAVLELTAEKTQGIDR